MRKAFWQALTPMMSLASKLALVLAARGAAALNYGVIGTGCIGLEHIRNIHLLPDSRVTAVCDPSATSLGWAKDALAELGDLDGVSFHDSYLPLLEGGGNGGGGAAVDALVIATPNFHHIEVLRDVARLAPATAVLVEKPLCTTLADLAEARHLARERLTGLVWVGMEYRYIPSIARVIREVDGGTIGKLRMLSIREHRFPFLRKVGDWNRFNVNTGGTLVEKCCHFFDLMHRIAGAGGNGGGDPRESACRVIASGGQDVNHLDEAYDDGRGGGVRPSDILDNAFVIVEDGGGGARCLLDLCMFAEASKHQEEVSVVGDEGKLEAFAPAHGLRFERERAAAAAASGAPAPAPAPEPNVRINRRSAPPPDGALPPDPSTFPPMEEAHEGADERVLAAGFHEGATYFEVEAFDAALRAGRSVPDVDIDDGVRACLLGCARAREPRARVLAGPSLCLSPARPRLARRYAAHKSIETGEPVLLADLYRELDECDRAAGRPLYAHAPRAAAAAAPA